MNLAFDRSVRNIDQDGRLRVATSPITKATVNPYYGHEIPDYEGLGLDAAEVYYLLRDPLELQRAVSSFNNIPLLIKHQPVSADDHPKQLVVGTTGSHAEWHDPYIKVDLTIWDAAAIAGIQSREQTELSSAYRYQADMTAGEYQGMRYDGVMRNIKGNHVALVDVGRAGHDVVVQDQNPFREKHAMNDGKAMSHQKPMNHQKTMSTPSNGASKSGSSVNGQLGSAQQSQQQLLDAVDKAKQALQGHLAEGVRDADIEDILAQLLIDVFEGDGFAKDPSEAQQDVATDEDDDALAEQEQTGDDDKSYATDEDDVLESRQSGAKLSQQSSNQHYNQQQPNAKRAKSPAKIAEDRAVQRVEALYQAREDVKVLVGKVALDSAENVYKFALDQNGVDTRGVHPSAYRALVQLLLKQDGRGKLQLAADAGTVSSVQRQFPHLSRIKQG